MLETDIGLRGRPEANNSKPIHLCSHPAFYLELHLHERIALPHVTDVSLSLSVSLLSLQPMVSLLLAVMLRRPRVSRHADLCLFTLPLTTAASQMTTY
ncbi:hypothetical protein CCMA1212_007375 [Trichoderma ghanense]|uniref:Uncharacterized protein n=1 Tax=Trichoderma ghanense TaxID=65468 RepID=A0ABY2GZL1_9HYPO